MKLEPKPTPAKCDRCGKTTTKYVEPQKEAAKADTATPSPSGRAIIAAAEALAEAHDLKDVCLSCWSIILSCVMRAGMVQARKKVTK